MINEICTKELCTGCAACLNVCPKDCICMVPDTEGFLRPVIDIESCDNCGLCKRACPINVSSNEKRSLADGVFACWNKDESIRLNSASGGAFSALAQQLIETGGAVIGAAFDENMIVKHTVVRSIEDLKYLRNSKYVQSFTGNIYRETQNLLSRKIKVLFSGTPCQVAALCTIIDKDDSKLVTCDIVCHGVPSPGLFTKYKENLEELYGGKLVNINFRKKRKGWEILSTEALFSDGRRRNLSGYNNSYMYGFLNNITLRPSCYHCTFARPERISDITLGDFWGIGSYLPFHLSVRNGISLVIVNSEKGASLFFKSSKMMGFEERTMKEAMNGQISLKCSGKASKDRTAFFFDYNRKSYSELAKIYLVDKGAKGIIKRFVPRRWILFIRKNIKKIVAGETELDKRKQLR